MVASPPSTGSAPAPSSRFRARDFGSSDDDVDDRRNCAENLILTSPTPPATGCRLSSCLTHKPNLLFLVARLQHIVPALQPTPRSVLTRMSVIASVRARSAQPIVCAKKSKLSNVRTCDEKISCCMVYFCEYSISFTITSYIMLSVTVVGHNNKEFILS